MYILHILTEFKERNNMIYIYLHRLLFAHRSNHRYNSGTQISAVTWQTVHEHIVAHAFRSKKISLALLVR